jgi:hypothetical protein
MFWTLPATFSTVATSDLTVIAQRSFALAPCRPTGSLAFILLLGGSVLKSDFQLLDLLSEVNQDLILLYAALISHLLAKSCQKVNDFVFFDSPVTFVVTFGWICHRILLISLDLRRFVEIRSSFRNRGMRFAICTSHLIADVLDTSGNIFNRRNIGSYCDCAAFIRISAGLRNGASTASHLAELDNGK